ncbi:hypothetical protein [Pyruvatibacter mobilis]|uniref:hypothetical protein n=1 Tax=Pyruvatibacter mobilis TaxID=1712261 RepID=UPI003BA91501
MIYLTTLFASFVFVFLKAFQQRNVAFDKYVWIIPTSYLMAVVEVIVVANIAMSGWDVWNVLALGTGGGFGSLLAALVHKKFLTRKES